MSTRSRAYPRENVEEAFRLLVGPLRELDSEPQTRNEVARMLGYSSSSGGNAARKIASLAHYGFLDKRRGHYTLSAFGRYVRTLKPEDPNWKGAMRDALQRPAIFNGLLERARKRGRLPQDLRRVLEEDFGVTSKASLTVATVFKDSGLVAGVFEPDGTLKSSQVSSKVTPMPRRSAERTSAQGEPRTPIEQGTPDRTDIQENFAGQSRTWVWSLQLNTGSGRFTLRLPEPVSETDMEAVRKHIVFYLSMIDRETQRIQEA